MRELIFDASCGVCNKVIESLIKRGIIKESELVPVKNKQDINLINVKYMLEIKELSEMLLITNSKIYNGFFAFRELMDHSGSLFRFIFHLPLSSYFGPIIYKSFARNRHLFGRNSTCGIQ